MTRGVPGRVLAHLITKDLKSVVCPQEYSTEFALNFHWYKQNKLIYPILAGTEIVDVPTT